MVIKNISQVQMVAPKGDDELAVKTRLRILLQLALTIGRREGLIGGGTPAEGNGVKPAGEKNRAASENIPTQDCSQEIPASKSSIPKIKKANSEHHQSSRRGQCKR
jgi:hypothetical protein